MTSRQLGAGGIAGVIIVAAIAFTWRIILAILFMTFIAAVAVAVLHWLATSQPHDH